MSVHHSYATICAPDAHRPRLKEDRELALRHDSPAAEVREGDEVDKEEVGVVDGLRDRVCRRVVPLRQWSLVWVREERREDDA